MSKLTIIVAGILLVNCLVGEAFEYDEIPDSDESLSVDAELLYDNVHDMPESRQLILNPQMRRERRKKRIAALIEITGLESCLFHHDSCESLDNSETKSSLKFNGSLKIWHCTCEMGFYDCLHRVNSTISNKLGELHFTLHKQCYRNDHKIIDCVKYDNIKHNREQRRCIQNLASLRTPIQSRLFDSPFYSGKPIETSIYSVKTPQAHKN